MAKAGHGDLVLAAAVEGERCLSLPEPSLHPSPGASRAGDTYGR